MNAIPDLIGSALALWNFLLESWGQWLILILNIGGLIVVATVGVALAPLILNCKGSISSHSTRPGGRSQAS